MGILDPPRNFQNWISCGKLDQYSIRISTLVNLTCKSFTHIHINFQGRKLSRISWLHVFTKAFSAKFGGVASFSGTSEQSVKSFLLRKFPAIWYLTCRCTPIGVYSNVSHTIYPLRKILHALYPKETQNVISQVDICVSNSNWLAKQYNCNHDWYYLSVASLWCFSFSLKSTDSVQLGQRGCQPPADVYSHELVCDA